MPIRRINSTGRKKILAEDARITIRRAGALGFDADVDLSDFGLPPEALVFVEAYRQTTTMRFSFGTVASLKPDSAPCLTEFTTPDAIQFRVKVTGVGERPGVLLAEIDRIKPRNDDEQPERRIPLLPPVQSDKLGQEVWRVSFDDTRPLLLVNDRVGDWKAVAASPMFRALVYPAAMRQVLWHVYKIEEVRDTEDMNLWGCQWLKFAESLAGDPVPPEGSSDEDWSDWIDAAITAFTRDHRMADHYAMAYEAEGSI